MAWECAECHRREGEEGIRIDAVCHHCGKPLCRDDRVVLADPAFAPGPRGAFPVAAHCQACKSLHPMSLRREWQADD
jgi:hypothetical protein